MEDYFIEIIVDGDKLPAEFYFDRITGWEEGVAEEIAPMLPADCVNVELTCIINDICTGEQGKGTIILDWYSLDEAWRMLHKSFGSKNELVAVWLIETAKTAFFGFEHTEMVAMFQKLLYSKMIPNYQLN